MTGDLQAPAKYADALAYADFHRLAPIFHEEIARETYERDPFEDVYAVKAAFMDEVLKYVDARALAKDLDAVQFYKLEDKFGGYKGMRMELIHTLEYARIDGRLDQEVWTTIENNTPVEANSLGATFSPDDVYFD